MRHYQAVFSRQALDFVTEADGATFAEIELWVDRMERAPSTPGDYTEMDADSRELQVVVLRRAAIAYWPDHARREVRIVRIEPNQDR